MGELIYTSRCIVTNNPSNANVIGGGAQAAEDKVVQQ
jgi:hypothetical protein